MHPKALTAGLLQTEFDGPSQRIHSPQPEKRGQGPVPTAGETGPPVCGRRCGVACRQPNHHNPRTSRGASNSHSDDPDVRDLHIRKWHEAADFRDAAIPSGIGGTAEALGALIPLPNLTHCSHSTTSRRQSTLQRSA